MRITDKKKTSQAHDYICLQVFEQAGEICRQLGIRFISAELEARRNGGFADVLICGKRIIDNPSKRDMVYIVVEVKTQNDDQSPGAWLRQLKHYSQGLEDKFYHDVAVHLVVVDYLLMPDQVSYLKASGVFLEDVRNLSYVSFKLPD